MWDGTERDYVARCKSNPGNMSDAVKALKKGIEKFPGDKDLRKVLEEIEEDSDAPNMGNNPPLLGLIHEVSFLLTHSTGANFYQ